MSTKRKKVTKVAPPNNSLTLYDVDVCAPDFFSVNPSSMDAKCAEFVRRAHAFYETMRSLSRVTILCFDPDTHSLYLASVDEISNV